MVIKIRLFGVIEEMKKRGQTEIVSKQINQPNKSLRCSKSRKLINYPSPANSIILLPLFVIKNILNNIFGSLYFTQPWPYHVFYFLSCHFHKLHRYIYIYIFIWAEQSTWSGCSFPDLVFRVLLFRVLRSRPIKWFCKLVFRI